MSVHILRVYPIPDIEEMEAAAKGLPPCPVCGARAYVHKEVVEGFYFGWSCGCPRFRHDDGVHGTTFGTPDNDCFATHGAHSKKDAARWWRRRVERHNRQSEGTA